LETAIKTVQPAAHSGKMLIHFARMLEISHNVEFWMALTI
jgi:hypothetical protein